MEPSADQSFEALTTEPFVTIPSWPAFGEPAPVGRPRRRRLRVIVLSFAIVALVVALGATALVEASQRRQAEDTVRSTRRDLTSTQDELAAARNDLTAARAATDAAEAVSAEQRARADDAELKLEPATAVLQQSLASELASTGELSPETATCIAKSTIDEVGLAVTLQAALANAPSEVPSDFVRALLHATGDCVALPLPTT